MNILFLCTGNKNRSAAAEYMAKKLLENTNHGIDSAGTKFKCSGQNSPMGKKTREALKSYDLNIGVKDHRSKYVTKELIEWSDKILYMIPGHKKDMIRDFPESSEKLVSLASFSGGKYNHIDDPAWTNGIEIAHVVLDQINECLNTMIKEWQLI